jgi:hypothetical protein
LPYGEIDKDVKNILYKEVIAVFTHFCCYITEEDKNKSSFIKEILHRDDGSPRKIFSVLQNI